MKKIAILFLLLAVLAGTAMAMGVIEDKFMDHPIHGELYQADDGLYAGAVAGSPWLSEFDAIGFSVTPYIGYKMEVIDNFVLSAEFGLPILYIGSDASDTLILANLNVGGKYYVNLGDGNLFFGLAFPTNLFAYCDGNSEAFNTIGMDFTVGYKTDTFGIDLRIPNYVYVDGGEASFFDSLIYLTGWYNMDSLTIGATMSLPFFISFGMDIFGIGITPQIAYKLSDSMTIVGALPINFIGSDFMDIEFGAFAGLTFKF